MDEENVKMNGSGLNAAGEITKTGNTNESQPAHQKQKIFLSGCLVLAFFLLGASFNLLGPSLVHLGYLYNASTSQMAFSFTFLSLGYLIGSILSGTVFDRFNRELQFFGTCMMIGLATLATPWIPSLYGFYAGVLVMSAVMGYCDACGQPYSIRLWAGHRLKGPIVQLLYAIWTIGTFFGPLIVGPFLVELPTPQNSTECDITYSNGAGNNNSVVLANNANCSSEVNIANGTESDVPDYIIPPGMEKVRYGYIVAGFAMCIVSVTFIFAYIITRKIKLIEDEKSSGDAAKEDKDSEKRLANDLFFKLTLLILQLFFIFFLMASVGIMSGMVSTFVIKGLHWSVKNGPLVSSAFSGAQAAARLIAIPTSAFIPPLAMLTFNTTLAVVAGIMMTFVEVANHPALMWISTIMAGFGLGTTFPAALLWTSTFMSMTGRVGSIFFIGGSFGIMGSTALAGYLFDNYSHMWVPYLTLISAIIDMLLFIVMVLFVKIYKKRSGKLALNETPKAEVNGAVVEKELQPLKS